jgi:hypothetical protein
MSVTDEQQFPQAPADNPSQIWISEPRSRKQSGPLPRVILPCPGGRTHAGQQTFSVLGAPSSFVSATLRTGYSNSATSGLLSSPPDIAHSRSGKRLRRNFSPRARPSAQITRSTGSIRWAAIGWLASFDGFTHRKAIFTSVIGYELSLMLTRFRLSQLIPRRNPFSWFVQVASCHAVRRAH